MQEPMQEMTVDDAEVALADKDLVPALRATIPDAREIQAACLDAGIPAILGRDHSCAGGGCSPQALLLVEPEQVQRVTQMMADRWQASLDREAITTDGLGNPIHGASGPDDSEPPCPACGHAAALEEGACVGCGLQLG